MHESCSYQIKVRGQVDEDDLNAMSPLRITMMQAEAHAKDPQATLFTIHADQSGLIGLMRHLHGRGLLLLSVIRQVANSGSEEESCPSEL
ncbi:MAG: hypothetical protein ACK2UC_10905 [Anaerolineae bacterium]|jgi:hypothetical protein